MSFTDSIKKTWHFLNEDTWQSWVVSCILIIIGIKFILFPFLSLLTGTALPLVVVESCSMHHGGKLDAWWNANGPWYEGKNITKAQFADFSFTNGITKGDIILVISPEHMKQGDVLIFTAPTKYPVIHRVISSSPMQTKGDNNPDQLSFEHNITDTQKIGKALVKIPLLGWVKLIFFEPLRPRNERGFCTA